MSRMRLADYFAVVGFNFDKKRNGEDLAGEGKILERFPAKDWRELSFPDDALSLFCQPNGWRLRTKAEVFRSPPTICTTVFTDAIGGRAYGVFLTFYEPVERDQYLRPFFDMEAPDPGARRMSVRTSEFYAPKTLAVLSHLPVLDCLKTSLCILYTAFVERKCELLDLLVGNMLRWQTAELDGSVRFKMGFGDIQPVQIPQCDAIPPSSDYTVALFEHLGIKNVLTLFVALLCGERVLLVSRAYSRLFGAAQALVSLLYPFEYAYTLLPLVPAQLVPTLVDNPTPFLYGIHESLIPLIPDPDESFRSLVVVNLDTCSVTLPEKNSYYGEDDGEGELPPIPDVLLAKLTHALIRILQPDLELADNALPLPTGSDTDGDSRRQLSDSVSTESGLATVTEDRRSRSIGKRAVSTTNNSTNGSPQRSIPTTLNTRRSRTFLDKRVRAVFVRFFAELLIGYRSALIVVRMLPEPLITFDRVAFLAARKRLGCKFFEAVLNSCLFQLFIQKRGRPFRPRDLFDEAYADILDRVKLECSGRYSLRSSHLDDVSPVSIGGASAPMAIDLEAAPPDSVSLEHVDAIADRLHRNEFGDAPGAQQLIRRIPDFTRNFTHTSRFPPLNAPKIESIISDSARLHVEPAARTNLIGESLNEQSQVIEIGPNPEEYSGSAVLDRHEQRANVESRLAVLQRCIDYIFDHQISDALKVFPAVLGTLQTPRGRLALARKLQHKVEEREHSAEKAGSDKASIVKGKVDDAQFDLISRLLNVALRADSATDEFGVAYRMMPVARAIFKPMGASHCQLYVCKQIQEYPVWRNAQFWETALYKDIETHLHSDYMKRARTDPRFSSFLPEAKLTGKSNSGFEERRGEVLKLFTELHRWRDSVLRLTAEVIRQRQQDTFNEEELKVLAKDEEHLIWGHINAYIDVILDYLIPVRLADATSGDAERRNVAACTVTSMRALPDDSAASLHDVDTSLLFTNDPAARAVQIRAVRFIKQFIDHAQQTLCRGADRYASRDSPNTYRTMVDARVRAHMDTMLETREALDQLPTVQPARVVKPVLLVGEQIVSELRCYLLADARDAPLFDGDFVPTSLTASFLERSNGARSCVVSDYYDMETGTGSGARDSEVQYDAVARIEEKRPPIGDQSRPATTYVPASGALFLTNYRVIFKGSPCEQIAACHNVSRAFAISALVSHKHAEPAAFGFAHAPTGCVHDALHLRSTHGAFVMRVAFDAAVSADAVRSFREQLTVLRKAKCLLTVFAVTANFADCQLVDVASGNARTLGSSDAASGSKQRTLMQRARQKATKIVVNPFKTKKTPMRGVLVHRGAETHLDPLTFARGTPTYSSSVSTSASALRRVLHPVDESASVQADSDVDEDEPDVTDQRSVAESDVRGASVVNDDNVSAAISVGEVDVIADRQLTKHASPSASLSQIVPDARSIVTTFTNASAAVSLSDASGVFFDPNVLLRAFNDEFSAYADYLRLGFTLQATTNGNGMASIASPGSQLQVAGTSNGTPAQPPSALSILKQSVTTGATGPLSRSLRVTLENARHTLCTSYPAVLVVPSAVTDDGLRKFAKTHAENRFPTVVWRHPRNLALLLRGSAFTAKSFASVLKQATPAYAGVSGAPISREDLSAAGVSSTRDAEQEKFFNALLNATPEFMRERSQRPLLDAAGSPDSFRRRAVPSNLGAHDPYASNANFRKVTKPRSNGESSTPTLTSRGVDANGLAASPEVLVANTAKMIAQRVSVAKVYVLIDKDAKQPSRTDAFAQCEFIEVEHHEARELREAYQRLMEACAPFGVSPNANDDESFLSRVAESGWLRQVQNVLRLAGLVVDLLDAQDSSVVLCLESGWEVTAQVVSVAELLLDPFYRTVRGFAVLVEKEWAAYGHRFSHRHKQTTLDAGIAPFFLQFLDCVNQIREQFPLSFEFNEYYLRFIAHHAFSSRFVDFLYDSEADRQASGLLLARQTTELLNNQDSFVTITESAADGSLSARARSASAHTRAASANGDVQRVSNAANGNNSNNASAPVHASQFVRFSSIWRYIDYYNRHSPIFSNCLYDASRWIGCGFNDGAVLRPQTSMPRLTIWNYFVEQDMFVGSSLYDPELSCVELLNSFSAQNAVDDSVYLVPEDLERAFGMRSANEDEMEAFGVGTSVGSSPVDSAVQSGASSAPASTQKVPTSTGTLKGVTVKDDSANAAATAVSTAMIRSVSRRPDFGSLTTATKQRITVQLAYECGASAVPSAFALLHLLTQWRTMMDRNVTSDGDLQDLQLEDETVRSTFLAETASQVNKGRLLPLPRCTALAAPSSLATETGYRGPSTTQFNCNFDNFIRPTWSVWWAALADRYRAMQQSCAGSPLNGMLAAQLMGKGEVAFFRNLSLRAHRLDSITLIVQGVHRSGASILKDNYVLRSKLQTELNQILKTPRPSVAQKAEINSAQNGTTDAALRVVKDFDTGSARNLATPIGAQSQSQSPRINTASSPARTVTYESDRRPPVPPRPSPGAMTLANLRSAFGSHLFKQGQVFRKWERHYFILDVPKRVVWQFESREEALFEHRFSDKWIELNEVTEVHLLEEVRNPPRNAARGSFFAVNTKFRNYSFLADDEGTAREWITRLSALCPQKAST